MEPGVEFWEFLVSGARDTWRVVIAPRGMCIGVCVHALKCLEEGKCPGGDHLVADDKLSFPK